MLSVRLPIPLEAQLLEYCRQMSVSKTQAVQDAIRKFIVGAPKPKTVVKKSRFAALRGSAKGGMTTDEHMRMTRGDDWNKA